MSLPVKRTRKEHFTNSSIKSNEMNKWKRVCYFFTSTSPTRRQSTNAIYQVAIGEHEKNNAGDELE